MTRLKRNALGWQNASYEPAGYLPEQVLAERLASLRSTSLQRQNTASIAKPMPLFSRRNPAKVLSEELQKLKAKHPSVGDVRHIGLFSVVEVVRNRKTREPMAPFNERPDQMGPMAQVGRLFRENGLCTFVRWNIFFGNPPLCISRDELMEGLAIVDRALEITDDSVTE